MDARFRIRPATTTDIEAVAALERGIQNAPHWRVADYLGALSTLESAPEKSATRRCFFLAEDGAEVIGFAVARVTMNESERHAELESVAVAAAARRLGIGQALCKQIIEWARKERASEIELEVRSRSEGAIALYRGLGFISEGRRPRYYSQPVDDAVLMRLVLT